MARASTGTHVVKQHGVLSKLSFHKNNFNLHLTLFDSDASIIGKEFGKQQKYEFVMWLSSDKI